MKRQNYLPSSGANSRSRLARPPLPFNLPSIRRESGAKLASGGIASAGAKWASPRVNDSDDNRNPTHPHDKNEEPSSAPKAAWGGAGLRPSRPTSDFPNLGPSQSGSPPDSSSAPTASSVGVADPFDVASPADDSTSKACSEPNLNNELPVTTTAQPHDIIDSPDCEQVPTSRVSTEKPSSSSSQMVDNAASDAGKETASNVPASALSAFANNDDDDDEDWADDSEGMDFLSEPISLPEISFPEVPAASQQPETSHSSILTSTPSQSSPSPTPSARSMFPPPPTASPAQGPSRHPHILQSPAPHWGVHNRAHGSHTRASDSSAYVVHSKSISQRPSPMFPDRRVHHAPPSYKDGNSLTDADIKVIEDQKSIMKTKAELAQEVRKREEEQRERDQKERSARKLRELEERLRKKKEQEAAIATPAPLLVERLVEHSVNASNSVANGQIDAPIINAAPASPRAAPAAPRVLLRRSKPEPPVRRDVPPQDRLSGSQRPPATYAAVSGQRLRNSSTHRMPSDGRPGSQGPPHMRHRRTVGPVRDYDGPAENESRDQWLERRRKKTETRNAVRSIIELMITRAVNGGHAAPKRMQHRRGPPSAAHLQRRDHGRRGPPGAMRPDPNADPHNSDRSRHGPPRRDGRPPFPNAPRPTGRPGDVSTRGPPRHDPPRHDPPPRPEVALRGSAPRDGAPAKEQASARDELAPKDNAPVRNSTIEKRAAPVPVRPAPWAPKPHAPPMHPTGMSPMAALRAQEAAVAAQRANTVRGEASCSGTTSPMAATPSSSTADLLVSRSKSQSTNQPSSQKMSVPRAGSSSQSYSTSEMQRSLPPPASIEKPSNVSTAKGTGTETATVSSKSGGSSVNDEMKPGVTSPQVGGNVKVLMNPNARRELSRDMHSAGRGGGTGPLNARQGLSTALGDAGRGRGGPHRRRGAKPDFGRRDRRDNHRKNDHIFTSEQNGNDATVDNRDGEPYGPSLAAPLTIVHDEKEESKAWANASNASAPPTSFDAIKRAFSNQPAPFALVGAPMIPPVPVVSEISSSADAKPTAPFESKHDAWSSGSGEAWSGRTAGSKGGAEWWKPGVQGGAPPLVGPDVNTSSAKPAHHVAKGSHDTGRTDHAARPSPPDRTSIPANRQRGSGDGPSRDEFTGRGRGRRLPRPARKLRRGHTGRADGRDGGGQGLMRERVPTAPDDTASPSTRAGGIDRSHGAVKAAGASEGPPGAAEVATPENAEASTNGDNTEKMDSASQMSSPASTALPHVGTDSKTPMNNGVRCGTGGRGRGRRPSGRSRRREGGRDPSVRSASSRNDLPAVQTGDASTSTSRSVDGRRNEQMERRAETRTGNSSAVSTIGASRPTNDDSGHHDREGATRAEDGGESSRLSAANGNNAETGAASVSKGDETKSLRRSPDSSLVNRSLDIGNQSAEGLDPLSVREDDVDRNQTGENGMAERGRGKGRGRGGRGRRGRGGRWRGRGGRGRGRGGSVETLISGTGADGGDDTLKLTVVNGAVTADI